MVKIFTDEERREIMAAALDAVKNESSKARQRGDVGLTSNKTERMKLRESIVKDIRKTVRVNVVNAVLSFLPREAQAAIQTSAFASDVARRAAEAVGAPADVASKVALAAGISGAIAGPAIVQAQRSVRRREEQRRALLAARGPFASPEIPIGELEFSEQLQETKTKISDLGTALLTGRFEKAKDILTFLVDKGRAGAAAARAYTEAIADAGIKEHTFAKTAAEEEFNKQAGRIPMNIYRAYSVLYERANREFEGFAKDPPLKG